MGIYKTGRPFKYDPTCDKVQKPPCKPGEYRIRDDSSEIIYIGETNDLERRMNEHIRSGKLSTGEDGQGTFEYQIADGRSTSNTRREHERQKIAEHQPSLNRSKGGEGRPAK